MSVLATRFGHGVHLSNSNIPLDNEALFRIAPSIFAEEKHGSRSERYTYIPTIQVVEGLRKEGFMPFSACQSRSRIEGKSEFTKHMLRFRQDGLIKAEEANEIILINSHDGTSSYQMIGGMFRFVCCNGMVTGDVIEDIRIKHKGQIVENVIEGAFTILDQFAPAIEHREIMKDTRLNRGEQEIFARAAMALKYDEKDEAPISTRQILQPKRMADKQDDLWTNFNVIQENLIRGGIHGRSSNGRNMTTRPVESIDGSVKLNRALWILADEMARIKAAS
jgi:hypothetical protein